MKKKEFKEFKCGCTYAAGLWDMCVKHSNIHYMKVSYSE